MPALPTPAFPGDDGAADPALAAELAAARDAAALSGSDVARLLGVLGGARVLVPVVAVLDAAAPGGPAAVTAEEQDSHMAAVLTTGRDGRSALLAFSATDTLARWDPAARPVAVTGEQAAQAALAEGAAALVLDLAGPVPVAVERPELDRLAGS